uniref:Lipase n=1 Tax=Timema tahoe TaxID=61484 RepID=A0A7R9IP93_9NEOP|nr:unnamed protein product [Timema tahoe]
MLCVLQLVLLVADWCVTGDGFLLGDMGRLNFRMQQGVEALLGRGATDDTNNTLAPMEDAKLTAPQLIVKYGYYVEIHHVVTEDGFILELHRVPGSPRNPPAQGKSVFLLEHGLLCSSADWLIQGPGKSLAYLLADQGFDVWLGNARGNTYSRRHVRLSPDDPQFWNHDWHHMGVFDLPAEIDYILQNTQQQSLYYAGHSMGTTKFFVMASKRPEYNLKIRTMFALAPIVFMSHMQSPFKKLAFAGETLFDMANMLGMHEFSPSNTLMTILGQSLCKNMVINNMVCNMALFLMAGFNSIEMNQVSFNCMTVFPVDRKQIMWRVTVVRRLLQYSYCITVAPLCVLKVFRVKGLLALLIQLVQEYCKKNHNG